MTGPDLIGLMTAILGIAGQITNLADRAQRNMEKCKLLKKRVGTITLLVQELQNRMKPEEWMKDLLEDLSGALNDGVALVQSCQVKRTWSRVFKTQKKANKFDALDQRISRILEQFTLVNTILIGGINNGRFFENVLEKLLGDGACKRLPQNVKEELKSSIGILERLTNTDNMSFDAQRLLEWIKRDITYSCSDAATSGSSGAQGGTLASSTVDYLIVGILDVTKEIMLKARPDNRGEVQRLVHLLQQLTNIIQPLQNLELSLDPGTRQKLERLKEDLDRISDHFVWYNGRDPNRVTRVMLCGPDNDYELLQDVYAIEYYIQVVLIALRQVYERT